MIRGFSWALNRTMGIGGAVGLSTAANIFVGQSESPLVIRPYLAGLTPAQLFTVMTSGMAGVAGTILLRPGGGLPFGFFLALLIGAGAGALMAEAIKPHPANMRRNLGRTNGLIMAEHAMFVLGQKIVVSGQFLIDSESSLKSTTARMGDAPPTKDAAAVHRGEAKVESIAKDAITLSHGPIADLQWPPMTMAKLPAACQTVLRAD